MAKVSKLNLENLKIARKNRGIGTIEASALVSASQTDLVAMWEKGKSLPTWSQLEKLAEVYNISPILLAGKERITEYKVIPDFRVGANPQSDDKVKKLINLVISRQMWLEDELKRSGVAKNSLLGVGRTTTNPSQLAKLIQQRLGIDLNEIKSFRGASGKKKALDYLISRAEEKGIFVGRTFSYQRIEVDDLRGLFISNDYCPFIILNHKDAAAGQIFSFIHELGHLFRKTDAVSNSTEFRGNAKGIEEEEVFCNRVAVELLLPTGEFEKDAYNKDEIVQIADRNKVSELAVFYRLKDLGKIPKNIAGDLESLIKEEMQNNLAQKDARDKERESGGNFYNSLNLSNGNLFKNTVLRAYKDKNVGFIEAASLLGGSPEKV